ncbi:MAG TPA: CarD family transcriptional regulator [Anaerolineae bacterium]|jgi:CarD family transcriptional regulator|nr:CarD family transcriptional regulator [Anaerolineae bacterium]
MRFSVGDKVLYPSRGAGTIVDTDHSELVDGFADYYVIKIDSQRLTLRVPMSKAEELGLRRVMSRRKLSHIWATLSAPPSPLPDDFKKRQEQIREMLRSGQPLVIAEAVRDLTCRQVRSYLTKADERLLAQGRGSLVDEVALVLDKDTAEAEQLLDNALAVHITAASDAAPAGAPAGAVDGR